jgi:biotin carboxylase
MIRPVARVLLLVPTGTYRAHDFVRAAATLGAEVVVASEERQTLADAMGDRALVVPFDDVEAGLAAIEALHRRSPVDAIVALDDQGVILAAAASDRLGLAHNSPTAVAATRDKAAMRHALDMAGVPQPWFARFDDPEHVPDVGFPCVVKPVGLSASRGVIRADDEDAARVAAARALAIAGRGPLLVEQYVEGAEIAVEALLRDGRLEVLAVFDKPDPLVGPYFEETIYVTPSRLSVTQRSRVERVTADAADALGLREGPVHAEMRLDGDAIWVIELAARSIGGLCSRTLRFGGGISLEEVILRHALGLPLDALSREDAASGVMMLPIPRAGVLEAVHGRDAALATTGVVGLEITVPVGRAVEPLPEGDRYLGFLFARGDTPEAVEAALRTAYGELEVVLSDSSS